MRLLWYVSLTALNWQTWIAREARIESREGTEHKR